MTRWDLLTENLTDAERLAFCAAADSAGNSGFDFGFTDEVVSALAPGFNAKQVGALLTNLERKGVLHIDGEGMRVNGRGPVIHQLWFPDAVREVVEEYYRPL